MWTADDNLAIPPTLFTQHIDSMKHPQCISVADGISGNADKVDFVSLQKASLNKILAL
jgi:hypothetical protein